MFDKTFKKLSRVCGEAIYFSFQPLSLAKVPEVLTGRKFVLSFWFLNGKKSVEIKQYPADIVTDGGLPFALWTLPGAVSAMLYDQDASVFWSVLERINDSFVHLRTGTVSIEAGPPNILDYDDAPYSRYIDRVTMVNDPSNKDADSNFDVKTFLYDAISTVPVDLVPTNSVAPAITGTAQVGQVLTASNGTWTNSPTGYTHRWSSGGVTISGATSPTYTIQSSDAGKTITVTVTATNSFGSSGASSAPTAAVTNAATSAPANTVLPAISGTAQAGSTLTATTGTWSNSPTGYAYQWQRGTTNISGATASTYTLVSGDVGSTMRVIVTATNAGGSTAANSASTGTVAAAPVSAPANSVAPTVSGTAQAGQTLTATSGTWSGSPTYAYQWQRGSTNISGATASTYTVVAGDVGSTLKVIVTATNAGGSVSASSANTATVIAAPVTSTERSFSYNEYQPGWTLVREETSNPSNLRVNNNNGLESASHYMSVMTGTDARATLNHFFKTTVADRKDGLYFEVSVDGGDYTRTPYNDATDDYQLFSGLTDVPHLVAVRTPAALYESVYIKKSDNPLKITGSAPTLKLVDQWLQPGQPNSNVHVGNGLDGFTAGPNNEMLVGGSLVNNANAVVTPRKVTDYRSGGTPSMSFRANVTELWFVTGQRMVHVWDGTQMFVVDTGKDAAGGQGGNNIRVKRLTGLSGLKAYYVWTSSNGLATYFSVGLVGGTAQPLVEGNRTFDQYGDSITQGVTATAPNTKAENDRGYIETYRVAAKLGYTGCAIGVGGYTVANLNDNIAGWLERKTVTSADVAMIAIGQNNGVPDTSIYNSIIDKLLDKGYGKVICRGVIPVQAGSWAAINTIIEGIVNGRADPRVKYMNVNSWTTITKPDGIHPTVPGYDQMVDLSVAALPSLLADAGTAVAAPTGFNWDFTNHPVAVAKQSSGKFITSVDPKSKVNSAIWSSTAEYWVVAGKDNSGDGLTEATAVGSIAAAVKKLNDNTSATAGRVRIKSGEYDLSVGVNDAGNALGGGLVYPTKPIAFIGYGSSKPITGPWRKGLAFTLTANGGGVYTVARSNVGRVLDYSTTDANGDFIEIPARVDEAAVRAATSGWFVDASGNLLVKRADGVQPTDANTRVYLNAAAFGIGTNNVDVYAENIEIHGGDSGVNARVGNTRNVVLVDMVSKYAGSQRPATAGTARPSLGGNAFSFAGFATGSFVGLWRCVAVRSAQDAIASTSNSGTPFYVLTVDCVGRDCGMDGQTSCNGLTQHLNVIGIDLNGEYYRNAGGNVRNIDATQIWALGTYAHDDRGDAIFGGPLNPCDFNLGGTAKAWFQDVRAANSQISLATDSGTTTYLRNATLPNTKIQNGTVSAY